ncbi:hypothetical protein M431DRAFT_422421 [Trichoderma harzianum CBS 226.95]|uniref:Uncharacterized protein n=1 Tax=Trichoderma harzianum CBS 226.95 TaxID=983964 RepID=A0A2T4ABU6_TRIHA|nr:hypothetical protein M431DRAFT_422421 [Trichoderma harzianum CBS 226.95]PTB54536.1 hypothetical protein M431DRAFT_422421 [Trichoderma harzianum CBS 226.95]
MICQSNVSRIILISNLDKRQLSRRAAGEVEYVELDLSLFPQWRCPTIGSF